MLEREATTMRKRKLIAVIALCAAPVIYDNFCGLSPGAPETV